MPKRLSSPAVRLALLALYLAGMLLGCEPSGDHLDVSPPSAPSPEVEQQAIENLVELYRQAVLQEDIDRFETLVQPPATASGAQRQSSDSGSLNALRDTLRSTFQQQTLSGLTIPPDMLSIASDLRSVSFIEIEHLVEPARLIQQSLVYRTRFDLSRTVSGDTVSFHLLAVSREGPLVTIATPGQVQAGSIIRLTVRDPQGLFSLASGMLRDPVSQSERPLQRTDGVLYGTFQVPDTSGLTLRLTLQNTNGNTLHVTHRVTARQAGDMTVQAIVNTEGHRLFAVTVDADGTVWAGGDRGARLFQVSPGSLQAVVQGQLLSEIDGRIEDLVLDRTGRLHAAVFSTRTSGIIVQNQNTFCQTVNVLDAAYPLRTPDDEASASTRLIVAGDRDIWLHGSDGGIARVSDTLAAGECTDNGVGVNYDSILRRQDGQLPSNTVPALLAPSDGTLWVGSALGLALFENGESSRIPFNATLSFRGNPETLESFFHQVAQAIFAAQPIASVALDEVSFLDAFGSPLIKEDLIISLAQDAQRRLWVGTLGGGLRRVEMVDGIWKDTLHLTRENGLASNIVFALAVSPDGTLWAATDDGVSHIQATGDDVQITNYASIDGLGLPARDLDVGQDGTVWVATDGGLFRISHQGGEIVGTIRDEIGRPVEGADIVLVGTSFHTVTDKRGQFTLGHLPTGTYQLLADGRLAAGGPFSVVTQTITVSTLSQTLAPVALRAGAACVTVDFEPGGQLVFPQLPDAELIIPPQDVTAPAPAEVCLRLVDTAALPAPLPSGFTPVAAVDLQPNGMTFSAPVAVTLPNHAQLPAGQLVVLLRFDEDRQTYEQTGLGRVSVVNGAVIETLSGGLTQFSTVVFAATAADATKVFLVPVAGNNQRVQAGQDTLPEPLVVRLEDQFGNPLVGETVTATIIRGDWTIVAPNLMTDAQGEARFEAQSGGTGSGADFVAQIAVPEVAGVRPVLFLAIVGEADTPDFPIDIAVADGVAYVADRLSGLQVIDVRDPARPELLTSFMFGGGQTSFTSSVALDGDRAYAATSFPPHLNILDNTNPFTPDFPVVLGVIGFPDLQDHAVSGLAVQGDTAYIITRTLGAGAATLQVIDVKEPTSPRLIGTAPVPNLGQGGVFDVTVSGDFVYVVAGTAGLLIYDVSDASNPVRVGVLDDPDLTDDIDFIPFSEIAVVGDFAYVVETRRQRVTAQETDHFTVIDVSTPTAPRQLGTLSLQAVPKLILDFGLAVDGSFAYLGRAQSGLVAIDIRNPDAPRMVGIVDTPSQALRVTTDNGFIYVTDTIFGLQVIRGPRSNVADTDGDSFVDFFDVFPTDPTEWQDTDGDRLGDNADMDDDNDGFTDNEEKDATPATDPTDPASFPVGTPPLENTTLVVDAATSVPVRERNGTPEAPYLAVSEALQAIRRGQAREADTILVRAGHYAPTTTGERFPLNFDGLSHLRMLAEEPGTAVLDAAFTADVIHIASTTHVVLDGLVLTHGARGILVKEGTAHTTISNTLITGNALEGILLGQDVTVGNVIRKNHIENNGNRGLVITGNSSPTVAYNIIRSNSRAGIQVSLSPDATPEIIGNDIKDNDGNGVVLFQSTAVITQNVITGNSSRGILALADSTADLVDNTIEDNTGDGVAVSDASFATINGGRISRNGRHGIFVSGGVRNLGASTAGIGLDSGAPIEVAENSGAGMFVNDDGSEATIDHRNIEFDGNADGDTVGNVIDLAP